MQERSRWTRLQESMRTTGLPSLLLTHLPDVRWLCGFTGSNAVLVVVQLARGLAATLFTDGRYRDQAQQEVHGAKVRIVKGNAFIAAATHLARAGVPLCGVDETYTTLAVQAALVKALKTADSGCKLRRVIQLVGRLRQTKDAVEQEKLARAAALGCELYESLLTFVEPGMREVDIAAELEYRARKAGAEAMSFATIVAAGVRSAMPHAHATTSRVAHGSLVTLDFGVVLDGYCSDMTRTFQVGQGGPRAIQRRQRDVFEAVLAAQEAAVAAVRDGVRAEQVDAAARDVLRQASLARWFTHSTGHGVGLEIHEGPRIAAKQAEPLRSGMVVTIEPGVYLPGEFGVRIEDTVCVTDTGCEILTRAFKGWLEL